MEKIQHRNLYREVADRVRELIEHGKLTPGERISEKQLCEKFGVSKTPLREALKVLTAEGLVEIMPNRGARVTRLTLKKVKNTYDIMGALEGLSGELACRNISDREIEKIRRLHDQMLEHYKNKELQEYFRVNQKIHESIISAANNDTLVEMYNNLSYRVKRVRYSKKMTDSFWRKAVDDHQNMIEALEQRNGALLGQILRDHLCNKLEVASLEGMVEEESQESQVDVLSK